MKHLTLTLTLLPGLAAAGELNFSPDRPGVGDSTATVGAGHLMLEGGLAGSFGGGATAVQTSGIVGRFGVDDGVEARLRLPDLVLADGGAFVTNLGLGAKIGGGISDRWSVSIVPEIFVPIDPVDVGFALGGNVAFAEGPVGVWGHSGASQHGAERTFLAGGGTSLALGPGGVYLNGAANFDQGFGGSGMVGGGGWLGLSDTLQVDGGLDVVVIGNVAVFSPLLGASAGF